MSELMGWEVGSDLGYLRTRLISPPRSDSAQTVISIRFRRPHLIGKSGSPILRNSRC